MSEQDEPTSSDEHPPERIEEEELLRARKRRLGKKLRSRGLIVDEADEPVHERAEEDPIGS